MPPPMIIMSTLSSRLRISWILSDTYPREKPDPPPSMPPASTALNAALNAVGFHRQVIAMNVLGWVLGAASCASDALRTFAPPKMPSTGFCGASSTLENACSSFATRKPEARTCMRSTAEGAPAGR